MVPDVPGDLDTARDPCVLSSTSIPDRAFSQGEGDHDVGWEERYRAVLVRHGRARFAN